MDTLFYKPCPSSQAAAVAAAAAATAPRPRRRSGCSKPLLTVNLQLAAHDVQLSTSRLVAGGEGAVLGGTGGQEAEQEQESLHSESGDVNGCRQCASSRNALV